MVRDIDVSRAYVTSSSLRLLPPLTTSSFITHGVCSASNDAFDLTIAPTLRKAPFRSIPPCLKLHCLILLLVCRTEGTTRRACEGVSVEMCKGSSPVNAQEAATDRRRRTAREDVDPRTSESGAMRSVQSPPLRATPLTSSLPICLSVGTKLLRERKWALETSPLSVV